MGGIITPPAAAAGILSATGVAAGSYTNGNFTVGPDGRLTNASSGTGAGFSIEDLVNGGLNCAQAMALTASWQYRYQGAFDRFNDRAGIDLANSSGAFWDSVNHLWSNASQLSLLVHLDNSFADSSGNSVSATSGGLVTFSNTVFKFGGYSAYFNGNDSGAWINFPSSVINAGTGDFSVGGWFSPQYFGNNNNTLFGDYDGSSGNFVVTWNASGNLQLQSSWNTSTSNWNNTATSTQALIASTFQLIALSRVSGTFYLTVNGAVWVTQTPSPALSIGNKALNLGGAAAGRRMVGWVDDFFATNGWALFGAGAFAPPTQALTSTSGGSAMLLRSIPFVAMAQPTTGYLMLGWQDLSGSAALNADLIARISRDGGATFAQVPLTKVGLWDANYAILFGQAPFSPATSGSSVVWSLATTNKAQRFKAAGINWQ